MTTNTRARHGPTSDPSQLRQRLKDFQIFFIIFSVVIGSGVFNYNGSVLEIAGPLGLLLAVLLNGLLASFVGECVSELVQLFPAQNAIYLYVEQFVDEDLASVAAVAHWYCWASILPLQMLNAARILEYWKGDTIIASIVFYGVTPWIIFALNLCGVDYFGWIETVGGILKKSQWPLTDPTMDLLSQASGLFCLPYNISREYHEFPKDPIHDTFQASPQIFPDAPFSSFCFVLPSVTFIFLGVETIAIAAYEARDTKSIARSSQITHWSCLILYFMVTLGIVISVKWDDCRLPGVWNFIARGPLSDSPHSDSATIISIWDVYPELAGVANGAIIFAVLSSANTCLYISSRTLYGMTHQLRNNYSFSRYFKKTFGQVWSSTGVPAMALLVSLLAFYWLPFIQYSWKKDRDRAQALEQIIQIVSLTSSISCIITWTLLLIAYLRYNHWITTCADGLEQAGMQRFVRSNPAYKAWNVLIWFQPWTARLALAGCFIVYGCLSATWWRHPASFAKVLVAYGPHVVAFVIWICLKLWKHGLHLSKWWIQTPISARRPVALIQKLRHLERLSAKGEDRNKQQINMPFLTLRPTTTTSQTHGTEEENGHAISTDGSAPRVVI
ncbi:hypothetical protein JX266_007272 [Neoarthrinium moseri]|nr:hypothetical protein JX266_007272 [Neoarthrinium moseri]